MEFLFLLIQKGEFLSLELLLDVTKSKIQPVNQILALLA